MVTREPGGSPLSEKIRDLLLDRGERRMTARAELLLFEAARVQHLAEAIRPALAKGKVVLCDRFADSTMAYQGAGRAINRKDVAWLNRFACQGLRPHLTLTFDIPVAEGLRRAWRAKGRRDRMEGAARSFYGRVRGEFLRIARQEPGRVKVVKVGGRDERQVGGDVLARLRPLLRRAGHGI